MTSRETRHGLGEISPVHYSSDEEPMGPIHGLATGSDLLHLRGCERSVEDPPVADA
jgi:hypothetical protein